MSEVGPVVVVTMMMTEWLMWGGTHSAAGRALGPGGLCSLTLSPRVEAILLCPVPAFKTERPFAL